MRNVILTAAFLLTASYAMASSSIQTMDSKTSNNAGSIQLRTCNDCTLHDTKAEGIPKHVYVVPVLKEGTQTTVIKQIGGEQKVVRTEAWLGGSPVVFISKASPEALAAADLPTDGVDLGATTGALTSDKPAPVAAQAPLDTTHFELRTK